MCRSSVCQALRPLLFPWEWSPARGRSHSLGDPCAFLQRATWLTLTVQPAKIGIYATTNSHSGLASGRGWEYDERVVARRREPLFICPWPAEDGAATEISSCVFASLSFHVIFCTCFLPLHSFYHRIWSVLVSVSFCCMFYCCANKLHNWQVSFTPHHAACVPDQAVCLELMFGWIPFRRILNQTVVWCVLFIRPRSSPSATQAIVGGKKG